MSDIIGGKVNTQKHTQAELEIGIQKKANFILRRLLKVKFYRGEICNLGKYWTGKIKENAVLTNFRKKWSGKAKKEGIFAGLGIWIYF